MTEAKIILLNFIVIVKSFCTWALIENLNRLGISSCKSSFNSYNLDPSERLTKFVRTAQLGLRAVFKANPLRIQEFLL